MVRRLALGCILAIALTGASVALAQRPEPLVFDWYPNGSDAGPQFSFLWKSPTTGNGYFGIPCTNGTWAAGTVGGMTYTSSGSFSVDEDDPGGGAGASYLAAQVNYRDFEDQPMVVTVTGQISPSLAMPTSADGTITAQVYAKGSALPPVPAATAGRTPKKPARHRAKPKPKPAPKPASKLIASCSATFSAQNYYNP